jgi:phage-related minor tail protein
MSRTATVTVTTINRVVTELAEAAKLPGRANGGPVAANTAYLVGERGPEVFLPSASGQIVPNVDLGTSVSRSGVMAGGGGNTYNINVNAGVGDPRAIGQQIVEYVRKYENASGKVFAAA